MFKYFVVMLCGGILIYACSSDAVNTDEECTEQITYTSNVKAVMDASCATSGCHNAQTKADGIDLSTYSEVRDESSNNRFMGSMRHESGFDRMPEGAQKLSDDVLDMIACWISNGTPE